VDRRRATLGACVAAYFGSRTAQVALGPLVPALLVAFGTTRAAVGAVLTGMWVAYALLQLPSGIAADRYGGRAVVGWSLGLAAVAGALLAAAPTFPAFAGAALLLGAGSGLYYNAGTALLDDAFGEVGTAIGVHRIGGRVAGLLAPPVAAAIAAGAGWRIGLLVAALAAVPALVAVRVGAPGVARGARDARSGSRAGAVPGPRAVAGLFRRRAVAVPSGVAVLGEFVNVAATSFLPAFLVATRGLGLPAAGLLIGAYFGAVAVAHPIAGRLSDRAGPRTATVGALGVGAAGYALLTLGTGQASTLLGVVLAGAGMTWATPVQAWVLGALERAERGRGFGAVRTVYVLLGASGGVVTGLLADAVGWRPAFALLGGALLCAAALTALAPNS
jgi:MFS family permease